MLLLARTTPAEQAGRRPQGLSAFLVDMAHARADGMTIRPIRTMMHEATTEIWFDNVPVPQENRIGDEGPWLRLHPVGPERRTDPVCSRI